MTPTEIKLMKLIYLLIKCMNLQFSVNECPNFLQARVAISLQLNTSANLTL